MRHVMGYNPGLAMPWHRREKAAARTMARTAALVLVTVLSLLMLNSKAHAATTPFSESFDGANGSNFVTSNAFWGNADLGLSENSHWFAESGAMSYASNTGHVREGTFRMWTRNYTLGSFGDVKVETDLRVNSLPNLRGDTAAWDGVKFWLRRQLCTPEPACGRVSDPGAQAGYTAEVGMRDGRVYIQKKVGANYYLLSATPSKPIAYGSWMRVGGTVRNNADGSVTIQVLRNGQVVVQATDRGTGGAPLRTPGRIGLRADNADINVNNMAVSAL
jgi:hypothetical protein